MRYRKSLTDWERIHETRKNGNSLRFFLFKLLIKYLKQNFCLDSKLFSIVKKRRTRSESVCVCVATESKKDTHSRVFPIYENLLLRVTKKKKKKRRETKKGANQYLQFVTLASRRTRTHTLTHKHFAAGNSQGYVTVAPFIPNINIQCRN